jgi:hypothetical protein
MTFNKLLTIALCDKLAKKIKKIKKIKSKKDITDPLVNLQYRQLYYHASNVGVSDSWLYI